VVDIHRVFEGNEMLPSVRIPRFPGSVLLETVRLEHPVKRMYRSPLVQLLIAVVAPEQEVCVWTPGQSDELYV
jgi:hypothetical protein